MNTDNDSLFSIEASGARLTIDHNLSGQLVISVAGAGVRAGIALSAADLYELSDWIERYLDGEDIDRSGEGVNSYLLAGAELAHAEAQRKAGQP